MKRKLEKKRGRPLIQLSDVTAAERSAVQAAIDAFAGSSNQPASNTAQIVALDFAANRVSPEAVERLSRWCNSDWPAYAASVDPAQRLTELLIGSVPQRLIGVDGKKVSGYAEVVSEIERRI